MKLKLITIFLLISSLVFSQKEISEVPKLLVGIKIDGLQIENILQMQKKLSVGGFRKIYSQSLILEQLEHPIFSEGNISDVSTVLTGAYPCYNGMSADYWFDKKTKKYIHTLYDAGEKGIGTNICFSARKLLSTTVTDELKLNNSRAKIHAIGIDAETAIMLGGHSAESVTWIDEKTARWATSTYYNKGLIRWADQMNANGECKDIASQKWIPTATISSYTYPTFSGGAGATFAYNPLLKNDKNLSKPNLLNTPNANKMVYELAQRIFENENLGKNEYTDALMLQFTTIPFNQAYGKLKSAEQEDMYITLDVVIQRLISQIESKIGQENVLFFIMADGEIEHSAKELKKCNIFAGEFNSDRAIALLNSYLVVTYGQGNWLLGYSENNIFLNKREILSRKLDFQLFKSDVIAFMQEFEGVELAFTSEQVENFTGNESDVRALFKNSLQSKKMGDVLFSLLPGWVEVDKNSVLKSKGLRKKYSILFMGNGIKPAILKSKYKTVDLAPTLSSYLKIQQPNMASGEIIDILNK